jgi:molybdopterin-guanine dinucleotide biosynthesis protein A
MLSAAILAGGQARRFGGCDKSALVVGGATLMARQVAELGRVSDDILLVGHRSPPPLPRGVRVVGDRVAGAGPLAGLEAALAAARHAWVAAIACDMPFVSAALVAHLHALAVQTQADVVVPRTERGYHPLCAVYARRCHALAARHLEEGRLRLTELFGPLTVRAVDATELDRFGDPERLLANVNTPGALAALGSAPQKECHEP